MKSQLFSKTVWFNIITIVLMIATLIPDLISGIGLSVHTNTIIQKVLVFVNAIGNYILRVYFTSTPLTQTAINNK